MSATPTFFLKEDKTAVSVANRITLEAHTTVADALRVIKPHYSPFFTKDLVVYSVNGAGSLTRLTRGVHYTCVEMLAEATQQCGQEVCGAILLSGTTLPEGFKLTYQALGGEGNADLHALAVAVENIHLGGLPIRWGDIPDKPTRFTPAAHLHDFLDLYGAEYLVQALDAIQAAVLVGDEQQHTYLYAQWNKEVQALYAALNRVKALSEEHAALVNNPHAVTALQVGLGSVDNRGFNYSVRAGAVLSPYASPKSAAKLVEESTLPESALHVQSVANPHAVTKTHVGLSALKNWAEATGALAIEGLSANTLLTPAAAQVALQAFYIANWVPVVDQLTTVAANAFKEYDLQALIGSTASQYDLQTPEVILRIKDTATGSATQGMYIEHTHEAVVAIRADRYVRIQNLTDAALSCYVTISALNKP